MWWDSHWDFYAKCVIGQTCHSTQFERYNTEFHSQKKRSLGDTSKRPKAPLQISIQKVSEETKTTWNTLEWLGIWRTADLIQHVNNQCPVPVYEILLLFTQQVQHPDVLQCIAHILYMLSGDAALSSVVPFNSHDLFLSICNNVMIGIFNQKKLAEIKTYSFEFSQLIILSECHNCTALVVNLARCLVEKVNKVHMNNRPEPTIRQIPNPYNPPTGTVY